MKNNFQKTMYACFAGYLVVGVVFFFVGLVFLGCVFGFVFVCVVGYVGVFFFGVVFGLVLVVVFGCGVWFGSELRDSPERRRFAHLPAGIGVHFRIHYHYIDVLAARQNMVDAAVSDVVRPTVAAENPYCLVYEIP